VAPVGSRNPPSSGYHGAEARDERSRPVAELADTHALVAAACLLSDQGGAEALLKHLGTCAT
jgi:hypothetical protein